MQEHWKHFCSYPNYSPIQKKKKKSHKTKIYPLLFKLVQTSNKTSDLETKHATSTIHNTTDIGQVIQFICCRGLYLHFFFFIFNYENLLKIIISCHPKNNLSNLFYNIWQQHRVKQPYFLTPSLAIRSAGNNWLNWKPVLSSWKPLLHFWRPPKESSRSTQETYEDMWAHTGDYWLWLSTSILLHVTKLPPFSLPLPRLFPGPIYSMN